ncbi:hypothetical protein D9M68_919630 [compost metagenome]
MHAGARLDKARGLQAAQGLAHAASADVELLGQILFGGKPVPGAQLAAGQLLANLIADGLEASARAHRLEHGRRILTPSLGCVNGR